MFEVFKDRLQHAINAFRGRDRPYDYGPSYGYRIDKVRLSRGKERSIINAVFNRLAVDASSIDIHHVKTNDDGIFESIIDDELEYIMNTEANIDQTARAYLQDVIFSMFDEGYVAEVPVDIDVNEEDEEDFSIETIRVGKILEWMPRHVRVLVYNDRTGRKEDIVVPKKTTSIIENPFYSVMNDSNSILQRLYKKLNILDAIDEQSGSGKLNMIIQLPYTVRSDLKRSEVAKRLQDINDQLANSKYGIAYAEATEKIIQLNRPLDNNLMTQIEFLTNMFYDEFGITNAIMNGTADEKTMLNYYNRMVEPILSTIIGERKRKFLTKDARKENESIMFFRSPFKLTPVNDLAEIADKLTRNAILSANEFRGIIGYKPVDDPRADELVNRNIKMTEEELSNPITTRKRGAANEQET